MNLTPEDRAWAPVWAFACGDAPGASAAFMASAQIRADCGIHRDISPSDFRKIPPLEFQQVR
jgi:hypothetical protein